MTDSLSKHEPSQVSQALTDWYQKHPHCKKWVIAFSGGQDSHVLLHACRQFQLNHPEIYLKALHVDHQWQIESPLWDTHCAKVCADLNVPYQGLKATTQPQPGDSFEAWAREARYRLLSKAVKFEEVLLTAHTLEDQAETLLIQLLRGAGVKGLSGMGQAKPLSTATLHRPLLSCSKKSIQAYAQNHQLRWIEDPSNINTNYVRNYLRHKVFPILEDRFTSASSAIARSAQHCADAQTLLDELAQDDLKQIQGPKAHIILQSKLSALSQVRQKNVVRYWIHQQGVLLPPQAKLETFLEQCQAGVDKTPEIKWANVCLQRYRDRWYLNHPTRTEPYDLAWAGESEILLPHGKKLKMIRKKGEGIRIPKGAKVLIKNQALGLRCAPVGAPHSKPMKKWWQHFGIPPWQRSQWPLIFIEDTLAMVPDLFVCKAWQITDPEQTGYVFKTE